METLAIILCGINYSVACYQLHNVVQRGEITLSGANQQSTVT